MWGDYEKARSFSSSSSLAETLLAVCGPARVPASDPRWGALLLDYGALVHLDPAEHPVVGTAARAFARHAAATSNPAALARVAARLARGTASSASDDNAAATAGRARAACGALRLTRILSHAVLRECADNEDAVGRAFDDEEDDDATTTATKDLVSALVELLCAEPRSSAPPEIHDAVVLATSLLLVLLSTQLYRPLSPTEEQNDDDGNRPTRRRRRRNIFLDELMAHGRRRRRRGPEDDASWGRALTSVLLRRTTDRPRPPLGSISRHRCDTLQTLIHRTRPEPLGADGMYESPWLVHAEAPGRRRPRTSTVCASLNDADNRRPLQPYNNDDSASLFTRANKDHRNHDDTSDHDQNGTVQRVLHVTSDLLYLPLRLVKLLTKGLVDVVVRTSRHVLPRISGADHQTSRLTTEGSDTDDRDVVWITDSPLGDLSCSLLLLLANNHRDVANPYRDAMASLRDLRWESDEIAAPDVLLAPSSPSDDHNNQHNNTPLTIDFEALFECLGGTLHNELGALTLYTLLRSSPSFSASVAARSDLDTLVVPLLRTLYLSTFSFSFSFSSHNSRSLYVVLVLLLCLSQDPSFGPDAFRRCRVADVPWYRERRRLRDVSLGSLATVCLARSIAHNARTRRDDFLAENLRAVASNLAPHATDLHRDAATRCATIALDVAASYRASNGTDASYRGATRTLLRFVGACLRPAVLSSNAELTYALLYAREECERELRDPTTRATAPRDADRILSVVEHADAVLREGPEVSEAEVAMERLRTSDLADRVTADLERRDSKDDEEEDEEDEAEFTFTYEEESDPEVFFVPYAWEVVVCAVTAAGTLEWSKGDVRVFTLPKEENKKSKVEKNNGTTTTVTSSAVEEGEDYSKDVLDVV